MYIYGAAYSDSIVCVLGFDLTLSFPFIILGDNFLQQNTVIFNKKTNSMGFVNSSPGSFSEYMSFGMRILFNFLIFASFIGLILIAIQVRR